MDYVKHYKMLIARGRERTLVGYSERHHILPRCMGGGNEKENIVRLTPEEHYVAHQLLVKIHPQIGELAAAAALMSKRGYGAKSYGWLRRRMAIYLSNRAISKEQYENMLATRRSPEGRALSAEKQRGKKYSEASKLKMAKAKLGKKASDAVRLSLKEKSRKGERHSMARLTEKQVREILASKGPSHVVAPNYGVASRTIRAIRNGDLWSHLSQQP